MIYQILLSSIIYHSNQVQIDHQVVQSSKIDQGRQGKHNSLQLVLATPYSVS